MKIATQSVEARKTCGESSARTMMSQRMRI